MIFQNKAFSREFLELTLSEIQGAREFTGFLKSDRGEIQDILFFLTIRLYAAGRIEGQRPQSHTVREFFDELTKGGKEPALLSLHAIDPVLFKGMLAYLQQREPSIEASTKLLNVDDITGDIKVRSSGALVVLKKEDRMNFFFFFQGKAVKCHYAEAAHEKAIASPVMEQLVL